MYLRVTVECDKDTQVDILGSLPDIACNGRVKTIDEDENTRTYEFEPQEEIVNVSVWG